MFGFGKKKTSAPINTVVPTVNLQKSVVNLDKCLVDLTKKSGIDLTKHMAKVAVVMDYSGSMNKLFKTGAVQRALTRLMPISLKFDDNGEMEVWLFHNSYHRILPMTMNNYSNYVEQVITRGGYRMGGTSYAPVLNDVLRKYFVEEKATANIPTFVIYITDGANDDKRATDEVIRKSAEENIFIQFVGIGNARFDYLEKLDNLSGRPVDNTGFIKISDIDRITDDVELYNKLLDQYPDWIKAKKI